MFILLYSEELEVSRPGLCLFLENVDSLKSVGRHKKITNILDSITLPNLQCNFLQWTCSVCVDRVACKEKRKKHH